MRRAQVAPVGERVPATLPEGPGTATGGDLGQPREDALDVSPGATRLVLTRQRFADGGWADDEGPRPMPDVTVARWL